MNFLKKILCGALCLALTACAMGGCSLKGGDSSGASSQPVSSGLVSQAPERPYKIGLIQYAEQPSLDTVREAFMSRLEEWAYDETMVEIDYQNAGGDAAKAETICKGFVDGGADMVVAISDPAAKAAVSAAKGTETKVLFAAASDPEKDLEVKNLLVPEGNVTGTKCGSSVKATIDLALRADPGLKVLGLLYDPDEPISKAQADEARAYCGEKGVEVAEAAVSKGMKEEDVSKAVTALCEKAGAVFTPMDGTAPDFAAVVSKAVRQAKKPWYAVEASLVQSGALAAVSADYTELGYETADLAVELMAGKPVSQAPVYVFDDFQTTINQAALDAVKTAFPEEILASANFVTDRS